MGETIFSKIIRKEIPAEIIYETDEVLAFRDINPQAPVHVLIIPKLDIADACEIKGSEHSDLLGKLFDAANEVAKLENLSRNGYRLVINSGKDSGQEVPHLHIHLLGGRKMNWPPG
ncbi:MAG: histidine triad nucleotide-binding protein [Ignavibacteria bacterium]